MARTITWTETALTDLDQAAEFIARDSKFYAAALVRVTIYRKGNHIRVTIYRELGGELKRMNEFLVDLDLKLCENMARLQ